ncbi:MAG: type II toxin-antitoxin system Phd/YefM family antitoxin [Caldilineaceae bacterium]|nr:type II toxin-antitoxin system Phd/YefM family antitoxin [Caldilineaceae bacterium]
MLDERQFAHYKVIAGLPIGQGNGRATMTINVSSSEARKRLGRFLNLASEENEDVVIEVRGEPTAVIVSYSQYEQMARDREDDKRKEALRLLRNTRARV